ncbi:XRE family transcriptional regulator [Algoriphagus halophytocola]|uniref:XRE family transcriptional regulator n=1 Tax=Algoriphagus halophytocola TaxID=2991499 RepID=A0ABY6MJB6_9BACT|nr:MULTISPECIES: XRE family transcriptional regulator [unclassified Algoriphagus]UZD22284.1 XRE family transcriptional regulator [Algoriphagus sp. TR-M5]WBL43531.1 XRE family transcriptional regulator [Algoriphagus sp. TR-M9]
MAEKAYINPVVLQWARKTAKMTVEDAAAKVSVKVERYESWEKGEDYPTIRQAQKLAHDFRRPFALFFFPKVPRDFQPLQDFRKAGSIELGTASTFIIREIRQKQAWISELNQESGEKPLPFVGTFSIKDKPEQVAADILSTLAIDPSQYKKSNIINEWILAAEAQGIFVSRSSFIHSRLTLDSEELQGFAIADPYAPFVFVNSDDWNAPQLFTLVHELAHIWIAETGISNEVESAIIGDRNKFHPVELFCNEVAASALMPKHVITQALENGFGYSYAEVYALAKKFGVSSYALLVRLYRIGMLALPQYTMLKKQADIGFQEFLQKEEVRKAKQKESEGGPNPYLLKLNKNSRLFTQTVLDAFRGGVIEPTHASNLLNVHVNKFPKLESLIYG